MPDGSVFRKNVLTGIRDILAGVLLDTVLNQTEVTTVRETLLSKFCHTLIKS